MSFLTWLAPKLKEAAVTEPTISAPGTPNRAPVLQPLTEAIAVSDKVAQFVEKEAEAAAHALVPTAAAAPAAAPTSPAPAPVVATVDDLNSLALAVQHGVSTHAVLHAGWLKAQAAVAEAKKSHDSTLAAMKANALTLAANQAKLAASVAATATQVQQASTDASSAS